MPMNHRLLRSTSDGRAPVFLQSYSGFFNYGSQGVTKFWPYSSDLDPNNFRLSCLGITWTVDGWQTRHDFGLFDDFGNNALDHLGETYINPNMNLRDDGYGLAPIGYHDGINQWIHIAGAGGYVTLLNSTSPEGAGCSAAKLMGGALTNPNFRMRLALVETYFGPEIDSFNTPVGYLVLINEPSAGAIPSILDWFDNDAGLVFTVFQSLETVPVENAKQWHLL